MNEHVNPVMVDALRGHWPHIAPGTPPARPRHAPGTPPAEAQRVAADLNYQQHRESGRAHRALRDQVQHMQSQGAL